MIANSLETRGIFKHAKDDTDLTWIAPWECRGNYIGGDYALFGVWYKTNSRNAGNWCDEDITVPPQRFVCEAEI